MTAIEPDGTVSPARVLAALEVLGWPDDRQRSAHGEDVTPSREYWDLAVDVIRAADDAHRGGDVAVAAPAEVNWVLIERLSTRPHRHLNIAEGADYFLVIDGVRDDCCGSIGEVMQEARTAHHLCDLAGVPEGKGYSAHIDARVYLLMAEVFRLRERLDRLSGWHSRETGPGGMVGDFCIECGHRWPCDSQRMAEGTYVDEARS